MIREEYTSNKHALPTLLEEAIVTVDLDKKHFFWAIYPWTLLWEREKMSCKTHLPLNLAMRVGETVL